jgi:hypothetical protein
MKQYIGISRDHSGSMRPIKFAAARDYNNNIRTIQQAAMSTNLDTIVSVVRCGDGRSPTVAREVVNSNVHVLSPISEFSYAADASGTPLWDSVGELINIISKVPDADDLDVSFLIMVITDGEENSSVKWNSNTIMAKIRQLQNTDRWTFVFRVPRGYARTLIDYGIPEGNILEWDQTERGVEIASAATATAFTNYFSDRSRGVKNSTRFYADLNNISTKEIARNLQPASPTSYKILNIPYHQDGIVIKDFVEQHAKSYRVGSSYYQLTKPEKVQQGKTICIRDKKTNTIYLGEAARKLLNLPIYGEVKLAPGNMGNYDVFVQSTSVNRKLVGGTQLINF